MFVRGIRGAITVDKNEEEEILDATRELMQSVIQANGIEAEDVCCVFITVTHDLDSAFPAKAIRSLPDWQFVPLMCAQEIPVPGSLPRCIRLMILVNTSKKQNEMVHVYLREAVRLRPDLVRDSCQASVKMSY